MSDRSADDDDDDDEAIVHRPTFCPSLPLSLPYSGTETDREVVLVGIQFDLIKVSLVPASRALLSNALAVDLFVVLITLKLATAYLPASVLGLADWISASLF